METFRLFLFIGLAVVVFLLWEAWQEDYGRRPAAPVSEGAQPGLPAEDLPAPPPASLGEAPTPPAPAAPRGARVEVRTDVLNVEIDTLGGDVRLVELPTYPVAVDQPDEPFRLMQDGPGEVFISQTGLLSEGSAPNHHATYTSDSMSYSLSEGEDALKVRLDWEQNGINVAKVYTFRRGDFLIDVDYVIENDSGQDWRGRLYRQFQRSEPSQKSRFIYTYTGGVVSSPEKPYEKVSFDDMSDKPVARDVTGGWAAMIQHYFLGAWIPPRDQPNHYYSKSLGDSRYVLGLLTPEVVVKAGETVTLDSGLFAGPKIQKRLEEVAPGLELTVDYGWLTFIAKPLYWLLAFIHGVVGNWGWAIIIVTILIKLAFYKLSETSYRSMANMKRLTPRMQALKERYGNDRQKLNQALMDMYKREKINPLGGCLPILVQIPVFIALYWMLLESVELRQAPFILWWRDLSTPDPYYVLPLLMGATMVLQQKLNPAPMDPVQQKVMMILPVVFTVFFLFFPSGLVLYWVVNNVLSIAQQWVITRRIAPEPAK